MMPSAKDVVYNANKSQSHLSRLQRTQEKALPKPVPYVTLFRYSTPCERLALFLGLLLALAAGFAVPLINVLYGEYTNLFVDRQFPTHEPSHETILLRLFGGGRVLVNASKEERNYALIEDAFAFLESVTLFAGIAFLCLGMAIVIFVLVAQSQVNRIRIFLFKTILSQSMSWFDTEGSPNLSSKISQDLSLVQYGIGEPLVVFIYQMSGTIGLVIISFIAGWLLTLVLLACVVPLLCISLILSRVQSRLTVKEVMAYGNAMHLAEEVLRSVRTVFSFNGQEKEIKNYSSMLLTARMYGSKKGLATGIGVGLVWLISYCSYAVAFIVGFRLIAASEEYSAGTLLMVFFGVLSAAMSITYCSPYMESFASARGAAASIYRIIPRNVNLRPYASQGFTPNRDCKGQIEFRNVHFHYPSSPTVKVFNGLNLTIRPGEKVAIIGGSGAGKSTVLQLIQRYYDPTEGEILLDGINLKFVSVAWLRKQLGVVLQEPLLFAATIGENISWGVAKASKGQILLAARRARAHDFITGLSNGYDTDVGEMGSKLSGGQRQRVAIARALIREPKILLLDAPTSALDIESEALVDQALKEASAGRTTLIITHKLSTLRDVDRIIVIEEGTLAEEGTREELIASGGIFARLLEAELDTLEKSRQFYDEDEVEDGKFPDVAAERPVVAFRPAVVPRTTSQVFTRVGSRRTRRASSRDKPYIKIPLFKFIDENKPNWRFLYVGLIASVVLGCIVPFVCILYGELVGLLSEAEDTSTFTKVDLYSSAFICVGLLAGVCGFFQIYFLSIASIRLATMLRMKAFEMIMGQEVGWFDMERNSAHNLCAMLNEDCAYVQGIISSRVGVILQGFTAMLLGFFLSLVYSWKLALVTFTIIPFIFIGLFVDLSISANKKELESAERAKKLTTEAIHNIKVVKCLGLEQFFVDKFSQMIMSRRLRDEVKKGLMRGFAFSMTQAAPFFGYGLSLWYGGYLIVHENLHFKNVLMVSELIIYGSSILALALILAPNIYAAKQAASRLQYLFVRRPRIRDGLVTEPPNLGTSGKIKFSRVYFSYPSRPDIVTLRNVHLKVKAGESVALVGHSGSGKSTITHLLLRYYDTNSGFIQIGGVKLPDFSLKSLRKSVGLVAQEPVLFNRTIHENIAYGDNDKDVSRGEVIAAAENARIHSFIMSLPNQYDTVLGSSIGVQLSVGQKQKIAIARALIRNPRILLLDEATSALDPLSEQSIQKALNEAKVGRTTITVAHRLGAIVDADVIYVMSNGYVVESGTHVQLMSRRGFYYRMRRGID